MALSSKSEVARTAGLVGLVKAWKGIEGLRAYEMFFFDEDTAPNESYSNCHFSDVFNLGRLISVEENESSCLYLLMAG